MGKLLILIAVIMILLIGCSSAIAGKAFNQLLPEQKQFYWKCLNTDGCSNLLKNKQYTAYRACSLNCNEKASNYSLSQGWCKDSDNGVDYLIKGIVTTNLEPAGKEDYCNTFSDGKEYLMEGACSGNKYIYYQKDCKEIGAKYQCGLGVCFLPNQAPVLNPIGDKEVNEGEELSFEVTATDENGDVLSYSAEGLPEGAVFEEGVFTWTPTYEQAGTYEVTFKVGDGELEDEGKIGVIVNNVNLLSGIITKDTKLTTAGGGKYLFVGNVLVDKGITLTVYPGVTLDFNGYYLRNDGKLVIDGAPTQKVIMNKAIIRFTDSTVDWDGESGSVIRNSILSGWFDGSVKKIIEINGASVLIEENEISNYPGIAIYGDQYSKVIVKNSTIENGEGNCIGGWDELAAMSILGSSYIVNNTIQNNPCDGIRINGIYQSGANNDVISNNINNNAVGISCIGCSIILNGNDINGNYQQGIYLTAEPNPSSINIINNTFSNDLDFGVHTTTLVSGYNLIVSGNTLKKVQIYLQAQAVGWLGANILFSNNNIIDIEINALHQDVSSIFVKNNINGELKLSNAKGNVDATNNYWGTTDKTVIDAKIYDFYDDFELGKVIYEPIATEPFEIN